MLPQHRKGRKIKLTYDEVQWSIEAKKKTSRKGSGSKVCLLSVCSWLNPSYACYNLVTRLKIVRCINPSYAFLLVLYALNIYLYPTNGSSCSLHHSHLTGKVAESQLFISMFSDAEAGRIQFDIQYIEH